MNCRDVRANLPLLVYGELGPEEQHDLEKHLEGCTDCRQELQAIRRIRRQLGTRTPAASVDLPRLYREATQRQHRRAQRWRRVALAVSGAAAAFLGAVVGFRMEARFEAHQFVLRWGSPQTAPEPEVKVPAPAGAAPVVSAPEMENRLQLLNELILALADGVQALDRRDDEHTKAEAWLRAAHAQMADRLANLERAIRTLYLQSRREYDHETQANLAGGSPVLPAAVVGPGPTDASAR